MAEQAGAKGYVIARVTIKDENGYKEYAKAASMAQKKYNAKALVRGGEYEALEGVARERNVILEFPSYADAKAYFHSPEYQAAKRIAEGALEAEIVAVEGVAPN